MPVRTYLALAVVTLLAATPLFAQELSEQEAAAREAGAEWIALVDSSEFQASWDAAAPAFQESVTVDQWSQAVQQVRGQVGTLESRSLRQARYTESLPNAPAGEYVVLQYASQFSQLPQANETVVMMATADGEWRAAGYFVQPAP